MSQVPLYASTQCQVMLQGTVLKLVRRSLLKELDTNATADPLLPHSFRFDG